MAKQETEFNEALVSVSKFWSHLKIRDFKIRYLLPFYPNMTKISGLALFSPKGWYRKTVLSSLQNNYKSCKMEVDYPAILQLLSRIYYLCGIKTNRDVSNRALCINTHKQTDSRRESFSSREDSSDSFVSDSKSSFICQPETSRWCRTSCC